MEENKNKILTELPRCSKGTDYKSMVGMELELLYEGEVYIGVKILEYIKGYNGRFVIEYNGQTHNILCGNFIKGRFGGILGLITKDFKVNIGDVFKDDKRDMVITDREYKEYIRKDGNKEDKKWYKYTCNKCGWTEGWIEEGSLLKGQGCSCCAGKTAVLGINTIWDTDRWLCSLGVSEEDAKTHTKSSGKKVIATCPNCGKQKEMRVVTLYKYGLGCICGDGFKYPEKFMISVLEQLGVEYVFQLTKTTFDWCGKYKYDFYIPSLNAIIETHGGQHYEDCTWSKAEDVQENDRIKYELALQNGIKDGDYIVIDCRYSDKEWVKNNILSSKLNELFDLKKRINWNECEEFALKSNTIKEVCEYWSRKEDWKTTKTLVEIFGLSRDTIIDYLKKGAELGWCEYDAKEEMRKGGLNSGKLIGKRVAMYDLDGNFIAEYPSTKELVEKMLKKGIKLNFRNISAVCNGKRKMHKGYTFKYIED